MSDQATTQSGTMEGGRMEGSRIEGSRMEGDRGDAKAQPSGPRGDNPATAGRGETKVTGDTPEGSNGGINPSAPGETGTSAKDRA